MPPSFDVDVAILGAGTAGMAAYREVRKHTDRVLMFDGGALGTTCARVGCMPSKLLIAAADAAHHTRHAAQFGVFSAPPRIDGRAVMARVRAERDRFVGFVLEALGQFDAAHLVRENARFVDANTLETTGGRRVTARAVVIATGSRPHVPPALLAAGDRLVVNDDVFAWEDLPGSVAVFGGGVIGLELGQALHRLGVRVRLFGRDRLVGPLSDPQLLEYAARLFGQEIPTHWHAEAEVAREGGQVVVAWRDENGRGEERFDYLLAATGRRPNVDGLGLETTGLALGSRGLPLFDLRSTRAGESHIFVAGDANGDLTLLHEAADEGRLAGENAARLPHAYRRARRTELGVAFCDPQIGVAGRGFAALQRAGVAFKTGAVSYEDQGRARVMGVNKGLLHVYADADSGRLLGAEMIGPAAEHLLHLLAWAIESQLTVAEALQRPFYHPVLEEGVRSALRNLNAALGFGPNPPLRCIDCGPGA